MSPELKLHVLPPSHPCKAAIAALELKGLDYELVELQPGPHIATMQEIYGEGNGTVPGLLVDDEPVHGSRAIIARLEEIEPEPPLYPSEIAEAVLEAERWGDEELQDLGRRMPWGSLHFRPESLGTFGGAGALDAAGTDFAMRLIHGTWKYHGISCELIASDLTGLPEKLERIDEFAAAGTIGGDAPNAADLQIGSTIRVLLCVGDLLPLLEGTTAARIAMAHFPEYPGLVPAGAFPAGWVPEPISG
jgi:glutathione S-transferase